MVGRQLEFDEEVREVTLGKHGNQNYLRLQLIRIPIEFIPLPLSVSTAELVGSTFELNR
jgi:hypothetical protein